MSSKDLKSAQRRTLRAPVNADRISQEYAQKRTPSTQRLADATEGSTSIPCDQHTAVTAAHTAMTSQRAGEKAESAPQTDSRGHKQHAPNQEGQSLSVVEELRPDSKTDSDDSSIALDCRTGPSEVIVKGRNMRQIHVKFPPRPPSGEVEGLISHVSRQTSQLSLAQRSVSSGQQPQEHGDEFEYKPLAQGGGGGGKSSPPRSLQALPAIVGPAYSSAALPEPLRDSGALSALSLDLGLTSGAYEWDRKVKHDIINGIEYFEKKNQEMKEINSRMLRELDRLARQNTQYEDTLKREQDRVKVLSVENDEMKIKMDSLEKENVKLREQSMEYWKSRVKSEELYLELKHDSGKELKSLHEQVEAKDKEISQLKSKSQKGDGNKTVNKYHVDDHLELLHKISRLEEEIARLNSERDRMKDNSRRNKDEIDGMKKKVKEQSSELENRFSQFLALKKSFNDINSENEKYKVQLRSRRSSSQHAPLSINNNTWPKNQEPKKADTDTAVSYFDIPSSKAGKTGTKKTMSMLGHKRNSSESHSTTESLPPVPSPLK